MIDPTPVDASHVQDGADDDSFPPFGPLKRMPTGIKMLVMLGLALLPLGILALFASLETAREGRQTRDREAWLIAEASARRLTNAIGRTAITLRAATTAVIRDARGCERTLDALAAAEQVEVRFAVYRGDRSLLCASRGYMPAALARDTSLTDNGTWLEATSGNVRFMVRGAERVAQGYAEIPGRALREIAEPLRPIDNYRLTLGQGDRVHVIHDWGGAAPQRTLTIARPVADGQMRFVASFPTRPLSGFEALTIMLPILMWVAAALVGWFLVSRILLRPLARLERAVSDYGAGRGAFDLPVTRTPALEIRTLGQAFDRVVQTVRDNERALEEGIAEQIRLTRDVHHRVKNNLQVVASLLSLHARGAATPEIAAAYASIQRRVDALAIVQRNLFAEVDPEAGIAIRAVIAELASGMQQSAPGAIRLTIKLDIADVCVSQDVAVPVAFLMTELIELAMLSDSESDISVSVGEREPETGRARLEVRSAALADCRERLEMGRYSRVLSGLARQLREPLEHDPASGTFAILIPTMR